MSGSETQEQLRFAEARRGIPWRRWGPYLSERQWGTVREDYSENGDACSYWGDFCYLDTAPRTAAKGHQRKAVAIRALFRSAPRAVIDPRLFSGGIKFAVLMQWRRPMQHLRAE
jgi:hypothetical protein